MRTLDAHAITTSLATATGRAHLMLQVDPGTDVSGLQGILPADALDQATATGLAIVDMDGYVSGALTYCEVERRMCLVPGGVVTLAQADGTTRTRLHMSGNVAQVEFGASPPALPMAA